MNSAIFDKLLLTFLVLIFAILAFRGYYIGNPQLASFSSDSSKLFSGALLTLITGRLLSGVTQKTTESGGSTPAPTTTTSTTTLQEK